MLRKMEFPEMRNKALVPFGIQAFCSRPNIAVIAMCCFCIHSYAQEPDAKETDLRTLVDEVRQLRAQQQQTLERLDDLKQLLVTNQGGLAIQIPPSSTSVAGETYRGHTTASVVIIEYGDFECVYCRGFERDTYPQIRDAYVNTGKVRFYFRDLPLQTHPDAMPAAVAALCAADQGKHWQMHDELFSGAPTLTAVGLDEHAKVLGLDIRKFDACASGDHMSAIVRNSMDDAGKMKIRATPTFLIGSLQSNGSTLKISKNLEGAHSFEAFRAIVDPLLAAAGSVSSSQKK
jgi:protein-disulfide isomerase